MKHERQNADGCRLGLLAAVWLIWTVAGCTFSPGPMPADRPEPLAAEVPADKHSNDRGWWAVRFQMERPPAEIRWEKDLLIAHRIAGPIIHRLGPEIDLWRFHRRSNDDTTGHQFSFQFYTSAAAAERINRQIRADPLVARLLAGGEIREVLTDSVDSNPKPGIGDTSDPKWSPVMQDNWPYFIMGVSRMWLGMIDQVSQGFDANEDADVGRMMERYRQVNAEVTRIWQQESYHALLHHLNAVYGYEAMVYWEKRWKRF